jgi:hypothetical protein
MIRCHNDPRLRPRLDTALVRENSPDYGTTEEGFPLRCTRREAWVYADGQWHKTVASEGACARSLTKQDWDRRFGHLPPLPRSAFQPDRK